MELKELDAKAKHEVTLLVLKMRNDIGINIGLREILEILANDTDIQSAYHEISAALWRAINKHGLKEKIAPPYSDFLS